MLIPSVTTVVGYAASTGDSDDEDEPNAGTFINNMTCLALEQLKVTGIKLSKVLRICKGLGYFSFSDGWPTVDYVSCSREEFGRALA
jgi:hypothetical protein